MNGIAIPHDAISREAQNHPARTPAEAWTAAARALAVRELLLQKARCLGLLPHPVTDADGRHETDEEALIRGLIDAEVTTPESDAASCARYYERNRDRFRSPDIYQASHILIAARRDTAATTSSATIVAVPTTFQNGGPKITVALSMMNATNQAAHV